MRPNINQNKELNDTTTLHRAEGNCRNTLQIVNLFIVNTKVFIGKALM